MPEFKNVFENANDIYILSSYGAGVVVLIGLFVTSWRTKKKDESDLRTLEKRLRDLSDKQV